jgi:hypothetical protein
MRLLQNSSLKIMHETRNFFEEKRLKKVPDFDFTLFLDASFYCIFIYNSLMFFIIFIVHMYFIGHLLF